MGFRSSRESSRRRPYDAYERPTNRRIGLGLNEEMKISTGRSFSKGIFRGWRKALGQARIRRGKPTTLVGLKHDNLKLPFFLQWGPSGLPCGDDLYDVEGIWLTAFPRDKETYGIPDNEMYRFTGAIKGKKDLVAFFDRASSIHIEPRSWH